MQESPPPEAVVDCADEPIRVPGAVQPHGRMLLATAGALRLVAFSENWPEASDGAAALQAVVDGLQPRLAALAPGDSPASVGRVQAVGGAFDAFAHCNGPLVVVEFEPAAADEGLDAPIYGLARHLLPELQRVQTVQALTELAAHEMKRLTGFGRCLVYRFDADDHGEVLAEVADAGYDTYAGHRFPAADIPAQARELYRLNHIRLIPDARYEPVALRCIDPAWRPGTIDLAQAGLRSVSPVHLEYMRNMGTLASMSVSIVVRGRLWGLVSCHDLAPRPLPFPARVACEHLGRMLSLLIEAKEENEEVAERLELRQLTLEIVSHLSDSDATLRHIVREPGPLLRLARATGAAVVLDDDCWSVGDVPGRDTLLALARQVADHGSQNWQSDRLAEDFPEIADDGTLCAGVLALSISQVHRHVILWFRPEIVQTIRWAGDPRKLPADAHGRLHPRRSFHSWQEQVRGRSLPWSFSEISTVLELRQALIGVVLRRAQEMAEVATELGRVNKELEAFSYTVSHDLRAPMRHIAGYVDLVLESDGARLDPRAQRYLAHVKEAAAFAGQLVDALLDFSRMGRSALKRSEVDLEVLVSDLVREFVRHEKAQARAIEWQVEPGLPKLHGDPLLVQVAVRNLVGNAVKYTRGRTPARIVVRGVRQPEGDGLEISDNGVGFQMKYVDKLFGVFQRLHQAEEFEGTGIGLASVRRIVERHGGAVWARGRLDEGASFGFTLPGPKEEH